MEGQRVWAARSRIGKRALCRVCAEVKESEVEGGCWGKEEPRGVAEDLRGWHRDEKGLAGEFYLLAG